MTTNTADGDHEYCGDPSHKHLLGLEPLTPETFAPYGTVISAEGSGELINQGTSLKFSDLCTVELDAGAKAALHLYRPEPAKLPYPIQVIERHPLASQAFVPLGHVEFAVIVCDAEDQPKAGSLRAFLTNGTQGVQFGTGVWHHPLLSFQTGDFLIVDRHCADQEATERNLELLDVQHWHCELHKASSGMDLAGMR